MPIDWNQVATDALNAAKKVVGTAWTNVATPAGAQITAMVSIGQEIEKSFNAGTITQDEYSMLKSMQKNALEGILAGYKAIGIVVAEQAAAAAWDVVATALGSLAGFALV
jgi:hypothetical protein